LREKRRVVAKAGRAGNASFIRGKADEGLPVSAF
jgi:hypothetical protein